jgi:WD40 repeat protein/predicted Ser/Thr protein kinase
MTPLERWGPREPKVERICHFIISLETTECSLRMPTPGTCANCGDPLKEEARKGFCPKCLFAQAQSGLFNFNMEGDFGDYELVEEIGRGGMGVVYRARQRSLDRVVAIKRMVFGPGSDPDLVKRFRAEAVSAAALRHPNIVAIHEVGVHEGQHFFVMDHVQGQSLAHLVTAGPLPARRAAGYLKTLAEAVHYAHEHGILHRDLKPSNVLIDEQDQPRIVDFGLARRLEGASELTVTGQMLGSPHYLPPEQATAQRGRVSRRTDVYGLGATLYHVLTGRPPFQAESLAQVLDLVLHTEPVAPRLLDPTVPRDLETICLKCLEKEPAKRYPTAQMLAEELGRFLEGQPIQARPLSPVGKTWRWCRRKPQVAGLAAVAMLTFVLGFAGVVWQWRQSEAHRQRAETESLVARRNVYAADMKEVQRALEDHDLRRARELLDAHRPTGRSKVDLRSWEWRYFWARCQSSDRFILHQYTNSVSALAFSADGKWLAVRLGNHALALWNVVERRPLAQLSVDGRRWCKALAFSPRGTLLAWCRKDTGARPVVSLLDVSTQKEIASLPHTDSVASLAFSHDVRQIATLAYDGTVRVWDVASQQVVAQFLTAKVVLGTDRFATITTAVETSSAGAGLRRTNAVAQPVVTRFASTSIHADHYGCVQFSPDGRWLAIGEARPQIQLRDRTSGEVKIIQVPAPADGISALAFSPDSRRLAVGCGGGDNAIHVWDLATDTKVLLSGHSGWITALAFSPDGQTLASTSTDQTVRLWDSARWAERQLLQGNVDEVWTLAWSRDGQNLVTGARDGSVRYWDPASEPDPPYQVLPEIVRFWGPTFFPDSRSFLAATGPEGAIVRWDTASGQVRERLTFLGTNHTSLALSPDGHWLALGEVGGKIQVWDFNARQIVKNLDLPGGQLSILWFTDHGNLLAAGGTKRGYTFGKIWAVAGWKDVSLSALKDVPFFDANFSSDEQTLAIGYTDGTAAWWDLATGKRTAFFDRQSPSFVHAVFSPDGRFFATGGGLDGLMTLWDTATRRATPIGRGYRNSLHDLLFSPDSRRLIASGTSPRAVIKFWDVETCRDVATLPGVPGWYVHIGFSSDGNTLFAASFEGTALLWQAPSFAEIEAKEKAQKGQ